MTPQRIQLSRKKGWRMPPNTVKVDRTTPYGNPAIVGKDGSAAKQAASLLTSMALSYSKKGMDSSAIFHQWLADELLVDDRRLRQFERTAAKGKK